MTPYCWLVICVLCSQLAANVRLPEIPDGAFTALEKTQLQKEPGIENRARVYAGASARIYSAVGAAIAAKQYDNVPPMLRNWLAVLNVSLKDIDQNHPKKKKSKALKDYEIRLRKAIIDLQDYKIKAPVEQQDEIDEWLLSVEKIRSHFMEFLFPK